MSDPQTPATEAGRRLLGDDIRTDSERAADRGRHSVGYEKLHRAILAIEAEACASLDDLRCTVCGDGAILGRDAVAVHDMCLVR